MKAVRKVKKQDLPALKSILNTIELFPAEMLDDMIAPYLEDALSEDIWFTETENGRPQSIGFCSPEQLTEGTYNLYAIGVRKELQGQGVGRRMMEFIEDYLRQEGGRILIVETSGAPEFELTRRFYHQLGYIEEARIREFWKQGEDKVVFWKKL
jgi:ribosomal protein S18 acetylase RimI-like enzyme